MGKIQLTVELSFEGELTPERQRVIRDALDLVLVDEVAAILLDEEGLAFERVVGEEEEEVETNLRLVQTSGACPEQYDIFDESEELVGYLRLRHGHFTAQALNVSVDVVYSASTKGDGIFESDEREYHLGRALTEIAKALANEADTKA